MATKAVQEVQRIKQREAEIEMFRREVKEALKEAKKPLLVQS